MSRPPVRACAALGVVLAAAAGCQSLGQASHTVSESLDQLSEDVARPLRGLRERLRRLIEPRGRKFQRALQHLAAGNPDERREAILYLDRTWDWSNEEAREIFVKTLVNRVRHDPDELVRAVAARALRHYTEPAARRALVQALADEDDHVRVEAARSLRSAADAEVTAALLLRLRSDKSPQVRAAAAAVLGTPPPGAPTPDRKVLAGLIDALDDGDFAVVYRSAEALAGLTGQDHGSSREAWEAWLRASPPSPASTP
jgi:HEAT repeat protein